MERQRMAATRPSGRTRDGLNAFLLLLSGVIAIANGLRYLGQRGSLWQDEISAATHALQPWPTFLVEVIRNDIHPFLYFALLKLWLEFVPNTDKNLLLSSFGLQLMALIAVGWVAYKEYGARAAGVACLVYSALPVFAAQAGNLRMYALISCLVSLAWWSGRVLLRRGRRGDVVFSFVAELLLVYTHAVGFIFTGVVAIAGLASSRSEADGLHLKKWIWTQVAVGVAALPLVALALLRSGPHIGTPGPFGVLMQPAIVLLPWAHGATSVLLYESAFVGLLMTACLTRDGRVGMLALPGLAWGLSIALGLLGKPFFRDYVFSAFLLPLIAIAVGAGLARRGRPWHLASTAVLSLLSAAYVWQTIPGNTPAENYKPAARFLLAHVRPGDDVVVPHYDVFWGILRYCVGPDWGKPLSVMPLHGDAKWSAVVRRLGPRLANDLHLIPRSDRIVAGGVAYITGYAADARADPHGRTWLVLWDRDPKPLQIQAGQSVQVVRRFGNELTVALLQPGPDPKGLAGR